MPTAGKLFIYREDLNITEIGENLNEFREEELYDFEDFQTTLIKDIAKVRVFEDRELTGAYRYDLVDTREHRGQTKYTPYTTRAFFTIWEQEETTWLLVLAAKKVANKVANELSLILHGAMGTFVEPRLNPEKLRDFCVQSEAIKVLLFDDLVIPNMDKATLYGLNVVQTDLYSQFVNEGLFRYSVTKLGQDDHTIGIVRDGSVCIFNRVDTDQYIEFIKERILPLILRR